MKTFFDRKFLFPKTWPIYPINFDRSLNMNICVNSAQNQINTEGLSHLQTHTHIQILTHIPRDTHTYRYSHTYLETHRDGDTHSLQIHIREQSYMVRFWDHSQTTPSPSIDEFKQAFSVRPYLNSLVNFYQEWDQPKCCSIKMLTLS